MSNIKNNYDECSEYPNRHTYKVLGDHSWNDYFCLRVQEILQSENGF